MHNTFVTGFVLLLLSFRSNAEAESQKRLKGDGRRTLVEMYRSFDASSVCDRQAHASSANEIEEKEGNENNDDDVEHQTCVWPDPRTNCEDRDDTGHGHCQLWADMGECEKNPLFMLMDCPRACGSCFLLDKNVRCKRDDSFLPHITQPGEINAMFQEVTTEDYYRKFKPVVHSSDPWVVTFEEFMSEEEVGRFLATDMAFESSGTTGELDDTGHFKSSNVGGRTSSSFWCVDPPCWDRDITQTIVSRIENITRVPIDNGEYPQILRYYKGQEYTEHHDFIPGHLDLPIGPRLYTFFIYLSDLDEGGETYFPFVNGGLKVKPKKGKAVLWPSVLDSKPFWKDRRTEHAALPVIAGEKIAMNLWLHMYDFHYFFELGCTG